MSDLQRLPVAIAVLFAGAAGPLATARAAAPKAATSLLDGPSAKDVPEPLRPWIDWVLHGRERQRCPAVRGPDKSDVVVCVWAGRLALALDDRGGRFTQELEVFAPGPVVLPGDRKAWPLDLKVDGHAAVVIPTDAEGGEDRPGVHLPVGRHTVQGSFEWPHVPESLSVPTSTALLGLTVRGRTIELPNRAADGEVFLQKTDDQAAEEDQLDIAVHRRLADDVPMLLTTRLSLNVSGKTREVVLGKSLPSGFLPHAIESPLPVRIEPDGRLRVQLRPGTWTVTLVARQNAPVVKVQRPLPDGPWKEGEEVWVFAARPDLRTVTIEGASTIDPQQTTLPDEWKKLPAYVMAPGATMTLSERRRGNADPPVDRLMLQRHLWLDFDGGGLTARDEISGIFQRGWRLTMGSESKLGRVSVAGQDQFITRLGAQGPEGVEIRQAKADLIAESRLDGHLHGDLPAVGWAEDFQSVSALLSLPPGWRLVHASGVDTVSDTWIMRWTLLDLFLLLITGLGIGKIFGPRTGALALVTLGLVLPQADAPKWIWLAVLVAETLVRALPVGRLRWLAGVIRLGTWVSLAVFAIPFAVQEVRLGLHPALGSPSGSEDEGLQRYQRSFLKGGRQAKRDATASSASEVAFGQDASDVLGGLVGSAEGAGESVKAASGKLAKRIARADEQNLASYDPTVMVQTGPGVPSWTWNTVALGWNGPVDKQQRLRIWLLPPWLNLILGFVRVGLVAWLAFLLLGRRRGLSDGLRLGSPGAVAIAALLVLQVWSPAKAAAAANATELPDEQLLGQLRERLLEKPTCHPSCASFGRLALEVAPDRLRLRLEVGAIAPSTVPLPANARHWLPDAVLIDGTPATTLVRAGDGQLWLRIAAGTHQVVMDGALPPRETVQIPFQLLPAAVTVTARGWKVEGLTADGQIDGNLQLSRPAPQDRAGVRDARATQGAQGARGLDASSLPPFVLVERRLELGLKWQAHTRITRRTAAGAAVVLDVPLLPGESVVSNGVHVAKGHVQVNLGAGETETSWSSTLAERPELILEAPAPGSSAAAASSEAWFVNASPVWHVVFSGIPPVDTPDRAKVRVPEWRPWPGEKVAIAISKPAGTAGQTLTIDHVELAIAPGIRSTQSNLSLSLRSSRGGEHVLTLPEGAVVDAVMVNGNKQPPRQDHRHLTVPVAPGAQTIQISFREPVGLTTFFRASAIDLGVPSVNDDLTMTVESDRWILSLGGPRMGPAILFWSGLVVLVLVAFGLGRTRLAPLSSWQWILLGLGLSQTAVPAAALVAGALLAFGWRRRLAPRRRAWVHNLGQIVFALWTIAAVVVLFSAIQQGLLHYPDMGITGNNSYAGSLRWFADRSPGALPRPWVVSVPLLVYRLIMLAWALWLALAVIRWARWIWDCFTHGALWRSRPPAARPPGAPAATPSSAAAATLDAQGEAK